VAKVYNPAEQLMMKIFKALLLALGAARPFFAVKEVLAQRGLEHPVLVAGRPVPHPVIQSHLDTRPGAVQVNLSTFQGVVFADHPVAEVEGRLGA